MQADSRRLLGPLTESREVEPVAAWIAALVRNRLGVADCPDLACAAGFAPHDWHRAGDYFRANRLWALATPQALGQAPVAFRDRHQHEVSRARLCNLRVLNATRLIAPLLAHRGIEALVIKGPLQQERLFGSLFERAATDLDLWVRPADRIGAAEVLAAAGYQLHADCRSAWWQHFLGEAHFLPQRPGLCQVDLHHRLAQAGLPAPARPELFFDGGQISDRFAGSVKLPSVPDAFLISCIGMAKGLMAREPVGHYALEVAAACLRADLSGREAMWRAARNQRMERLTGLAITLCEQAFDLELVMGQDRDGAGTAAWARRLVLSPDRSATWPRRAIMWTVCDGALPVRTGRFAQVYATNLAGQACRTLFHAPAKRVRSRDAKAQAHGELQSDPPNPNPA